MSEKTCEHGVSTQVPCEECSPSAETMARLAQSKWHELGGVGACPSDLVEALSGMGERWGGPSVATGSAMARDRIREHVHMSRAMLVASALGAFGPDVDDEAAAARALYRADRVLAMMRGRPDPFDRGGR